MSDQGSHTKTIRFGKGFVAVLYPEVYFQFCLELMKNHPDLVTAMQTAQVRLEDGTGIDFLNAALGTDVGRQEPMELGFAKLLDALKMRQTTEISKRNFQRVANDQFKDISMGPVRDKSEWGNPLFPSWDELDDNRKKH